MTLQTVTTMTLQTTVCEQTYALNMFYREQVC